MDKTLEELPAPELTNLKVSALKRVKNKSNKVQVSHLDDLLDNKFLAKYFKEKKSDKYIDASRNNKQ